jgi:hypothetical protein
VGGVLASAILVSANSGIKRAGSRKVEGKAHEGRENMRLYRSGGESVSGEEDR